MDFDSEYRRRAMEQWQSSREAPAQEWSEDWLQAQGRLTRFLDGVRGRFHSLFSYGRSHNRYE